MAWIIFVIVIGIDQLSKAIASSFWPIYLNSGVAFSWGEKWLAEWRWLVLVWMVVAVWWWQREAWARQPMAAGLFFGGVVSNLLDRLIFGGVRDWLPVPLLGVRNNVADWAIVCALVLLVLAHFSSETRSARIPHRS